MRARGASPLGGAAWRPPPSLEDGLLAASAMPDGRLRLWLWVAAWAVFVLSVAAAIRPGFTWDEPGYVASGYAYCEWLGRPSLDEPSITRSWKPNREHPPAAKVVYGAAATLGDAVGLSPYFAARCAAAAMFTLLAGLVFGFTARHFGRTAGVLAALSLVLIPRVFGHGHLAGLDAPVALACFATTILFARAHKGPWSAAAAGLVWGVALLTKFNAAFLPLVLVPWAAWRHRKKAIRPCVLLVVVGSLTFFAGWPWLWQDTAERTGEYVANKTGRLFATGRSARPGGTSNVPVHYLGRTHTDDRAPWHYPFVMLLATVPVGLLGFLAVGVPRSLRDDERRGIGTLLVASALLHVVILALPLVPKYDGVRLFLPAFPFLACLAGVGAARVWRWRGRLGKAVVLAVLSVHAVALVATHPYELSYYNCLVGTAWGAERLGFQTTYWGETITREVADHVNTTCPDGSSLAVWPPYMAKFKQKLRTFLWAKPSLDSRLGWTPDGPPPDYLIRVPRRGYRDEAMRSLLAGREPVRRWTYLGVPQCLLFRLRGEPLR